MSFINRAFITRVTSLLGARIIGSSIVLASTPILTRIYTPSDYGNWVIWFSFSQVFASISSLGYAQSIVLPKYHKAGAMLLLLSLVICVGFSFIVGMLHWVGVASLKEVIDFPIAWSWGVSLAVMISLIGFTECFGAWCVRREIFVGFAIAQGTVAAGIPLIQIACAYVIEKPADALIIGTLFGQGIGVFGLALYIFCGNKRPNWRKSGIQKGIWVQAIRYKAYPLFIVPYNLIGTLRERFIYFLLGTLSSSTTGLYGIAVRMINIPNNLLASSIKPVFYQIAATRVLSQLENEVIGLLRAATRLIVPIWILFVFSCQEVFGIVFGQQWREAGVYAAILSFAAIPHILGNWLDRIFDVTSNQKLVLRIESFFSVLTVLAIILTLVFSENPIYIITTQTSILSIYYFFYLYKIFSVANYSTKGFFNLLQNVLINGLMWFFILYTLEKLFSFSSSILIGSTAIIITTIFILRTEYNHLIQLKAGEIKSC